MSHSAAHRVIDSLGPLLALAPVRRRPVDQIAIVDGTLIPDFRSPMGPFRNCEKALPGTGLVLMRRWRCCAVPIGVLRNLVLTDDAGEKGALRHTGNTLPPGRALGS